MCDQFGEKSINLFYKKNIYIKLQLDQVGKELGHDESQNVGYMSSSIF